MKSMGFNKKCVLRAYGDLDSLNGQSLPCGALALLFPDTLGQNLSIIDGMYPRDQGHKRRFCLCFDSTYLLAMHQSLRLQGKKVMVGAPFRMDDLDSEYPGCYQEVVMGEQLRERSKANRMFLATNLTFGSRWKQSIRFMKCLWILQGFDSDPTCSLQGTS